MKASQSKKHTPRTAIFPGSFDPLTNGHVDIVERGLAVFDDIVIAVLHNPAKEALFTAQERVAIIQEQFKRDRKRVRVESFSGLLVEFVRRHNSHVVIRGLRAISDYDYEAQMALTNRKLDDSVETLFMMANEANSYISSTVVKQVARFGGAVTAMVPKPVQTAMQRRAQELGWG